MGLKFKQAQDQLSVLLQLDRQEGLNQLKHGDTRSMEDNRQYLNFFRRFLWNSHNPLLHQFAHTILDLDSLEKDMVIEIIYYISDGQHMDSLKKRLLDEFKINKGKVYLDLIILLENKIMDSIRIQNAIDLETRKHQNQRDRQDWEDTVDESQYKELQDRIDESDSKNWEDDTDEDLYSQSISQ